MLRVFFYLDNGSTLFTLNCLIAADLVPIIFFQNMHVYILVRNFYQVAEYSVKSHLLPTAKWALKSYLLFCMIFKMLNVLIVIKFFTLTVIIDFLAPVFKQVVTVGHLNS